MSLLLSFVWLIIGIFWIVAGKPFIEVCACFLLFGIFDGLNEMKIMREEMEDIEEEVEDDKS